MKASIHNITLGLSDRIFIILPKKCPNYMETFNISFMHLVVTWLF